MKHCKLLVLALTGDCNFACRYCYAAEMRRETMGFETARRAISLAATGGTPANKSAGKVMKAPPPAMAFMTPDAKPAQARRA